MTGHIRQRGDSWELKFDIGRDEKTGKRITQFHTFKGTKKEAKAKLAELVTAASQGSYVAKSGVTVGEHVRARIDRGKLSARFRQRPQSVTANCSPIRSRRTFEQGRCKSFGRQILNSGTPR
jgi:hypothetical protein